MESIQCVAEDGLSLRGEQQQILFIRPNSFPCMPPHNESFFTFQHIVHSMKDPSIANFWLITLPQIVGGFDYDEDVKKKIWLQYEVSTSLEFTEGYGLSRG